jgi:hypothetical protein
MNVKSCRISPMKKYIFLAMLLFCPLLQGCVGFVIAKEHTEVTNNPVIALHRTSLFPAHSQNSNPVYTSDWLQKHWGRPDRIYQVGSGPGAGVDEVWTYRFGPIWKGVIPALIVPIPLVLPVAREKVSFTLHDGHVASVSSTGPDTGGVFWPKRL